MAFKLNLCSLSMGIITTIILHSVSISKKLPQVTVIKLRSLFCLFLFQLLQLPAFSCDWRQIYTAKKRLLVRFNEFAQTQSLMVPQLFYHSLHFLLSGQLACKGEIFRKMVQAFYVCFQHLLQVNFVFLHHVHHLCVLQPFLFCFS